MDTLLPVRRTASVRVPATTANLGPGFDALGLALNWCDTASATVIGNEDRDTGCGPTAAVFATGKTGGEDGEHGRTRNVPAGAELSAGQITVRESTAPPPVQPGTEDFALVVDLSGDGAETLPRDTSHLVVASIRRGLNALGFTAPGLHFQAHNTIPLARGLGSSSAAITAGLSLAWGLAFPGRTLDRDWAFGLAVEIEGHPDNVGPAVYGGFTIGWHRDDAWTVAHCSVDPSIRVTALVPPTSLETTRARSAMPPAIPLADAIANSARTALLVHALSTDPSLLLDATEDYLHQAYRRDLYPRSLALVDDLRTEGLAAVISGAGPTVVVLHSEHTAALTNLALDVVIDKDPAFAQFRRHDLRVGAGVELLSQG